MNKKIRVLLVRPGKEPEEIQIRNDLKALQDAVGGSIETFFLERSVTIICDEEGKMKKKKCCRPIWKDGWLMDVIAGDFLVAGVQGADFCGLTQEQTDRYKERFALDNILKGGKYE